MKKYPYIFATIIATLLAIVVWLCTPKEYTAVTKVSDEYKEMDLAIGMDKMKARIRDLSDKGDDGINDMAVYCKILKTEDFARSISNKQVAGRGITYGEYLGKKDTIEAVSAHISYNYNNKQQTLIIGFTDKNAMIAAQMLDSTTVLLQNFIIEHRHIMAQKLLDNAKKRLDEASKNYHNAQKKYAKYFDTHYNSNKKTEKQVIISLQQEVQIAYKEVQKSTEEYVRQEALSNRYSPSFAVIQPITVPIDSNQRLGEYLFSFIFIALLLTYSGIGLRRFFNQKRRFDFGGLTSPWMITIVIWGGMLTLLQFRDPELLNAPKEQFYISLLLWLLFFCVTSIISFNITSDSKNKSEDTGLHGIKLTNINMFAFYTLFFLSVVMTPLYVKKIYDVVLMFGTEDFMNNVRQFAVKGDINVGFLSYSVPINISLMLVSLWGYPKIKMWQVIWACSACILNSLAIMEKGEILTVFFCVMFVLYERKVIKVRSASIFMVVIVLFFFTFNLMRAEDDSAYQNEETFMGFIAMYVLSPPVAFGELSQDIVHQFAARTVPTLYYLLNKYYENIFIVYDRLQPFVFVPVVTNVYTIFQPFFQDFGCTGVAFAGGGYGIMGGILYRKACNGNVFSKCFYTYFAYILLLQFFQENFFTTGLFIPELILFTYICTQKTFVLPLQSNDIAKKHIT